MIDWGTYQGKRRNPCPEDPVLLKGASIGMYYDADDVVLKRTYSLASRGPKSPVSPKGLGEANKMALDVDMSARTRDSSLEHLPDVADGIFNWEIWTSKNSDDVSLCFSDGEHDYTFDMQETNLEDLHARIGEHLKIKTKKVSKTPTKAAPGRG
jgi:hypothetical protein